MQLKFHVRTTDVGYVAILPDSYSPSKKYPLLVVVHGIGERGDGSLGALHYLVDQFSWGSIIPLETQQATDIYDMIVVAPNYSTDFNPSSANYVFDEMIKNYSIDTSKIGLTGFSLGGGAVLRYLSSSQTNVDRLAIAVPVAPVAWYTKTPYVAVSGLPVWFHVNVNDTNGPTNLSVTLNELNEINSSNPPIPAIYTAYNRTGHGGQNEAWGLLAPKAPGGKGFIDAKVNIFEWLLMNTNKSHVPVPSGTSSSTTTSSTTIRSGDIIANAGEDRVVNTPYAFLDGRNSLGYKDAYAKWQTITVPQGENIYNIIRSGGWITTDVSLKREGIYVFELTLTKGSSTSVDTVQIIYDRGSSITTTSTTTLRVKKVLSRTEVPNIGKIIVIYDDGSIEYENLV